MPPSRCFGGWRDASRSGPRTASTFINAPPTTVLQYRAVGEVLALNIALAALAVISAGQRSAAAGILLLLVGCLAVTVVLYRFSRKRSA
jgi:hypothetical protein